MRAPRPARSSSALAGRRSPSSPTRGRRGSATRAPRSSQRRVKRASPSRSFPGRRRSSAPPCCRDSTCAASRSPASPRAALRGALGETTGWYEAPHRIRETLADLAAVAPERGVFLVRELTKLHEQQLLGTAGDVAAALAEPVRGEIAFVVEGGPRDASDEPEAPSEADVLAAIDALLAEGLTTSAAAKRLAGAGLGERRHLYARITARRAERVE